MRIGYGAAHSTSSLRKTKTRDKTGPVRSLTICLLHGRFGLMPRTARQAPGGALFHVLNRGVGRMRLFESHSPCRPTSIF